MNFSGLLKSAKRFLNSYNEEIGVPQIIIISKGEEAVNEVSYFLASRKDESFLHINYEKLKNLDAELYTLIKGADAAVIYSTDPLDELADIAFASSVVSQITFRYLVLLSSRDAKKAGEIIDESIRVNPCRVHAFDTRNELLSALPRLLIETLPVDCLPYFLKMPGFEEVRRKRALMISALNIAKGMIVLRLVPLFGLPLSLELFRAGIRIASATDLAESIQRVLPYSGALMFALLSTKRKTGRKSSLSRYHRSITLPAFFALLLLLFALSGSSEE